MNSAAEEVKSRVNLVDLIGEYIKLSKAGTNWKANCPFHREKSPSFMVSDEKQIWHCFGCGKGGDAFGFLMEMEGVDFKEALKILADKTGIDLSQYRSSALPAFGSDGKNGLEILELATKFYEKQLWDGAGRDKILEYLRQRGLKDEAVKEFRLGYAPAGWRNILEFMIKRGYEPKDINSTGLLVQKEGARDYYDRFRDRIIFPVQDVMGRVIGFSARVAPGGDESQAKYVNTPETEYYHKSKVLYGMNKAKQFIKQEGSVLIVEGNMDVIASHQAGIKNSIAVSGTALTLEQLEIIKRYTENVNLLFDMDLAGEGATKRSIEACFQKDINVFIVSLPGVKDAAEAVQKDSQILKDALANSVQAMDYFLRKLFSRYDQKKPADKKIIAKEALNLIRQFGSEIEKTHWVKELASQLEVEEKILWDVIKKSGDPDRFRKEDGDSNPALPKEAKNRREVIIREMAGLMLADHEIWQKFSEQYQNLPIFQSYSRLRTLMQEGNKNNFSMDKLIEGLTDETDKNWFRAAYFDNRFQLGAQGEIEEVDLSNNWERFEKCVKELKKEINRERQKSVLSDIRKAEESHDKEGLKLLMEEFQKISKELN